MKNEMIAEPVKSTGKYKQTEIGLIPEDWNFFRLGDLIVLKNGYAFKSEYFSSNGPIVITPGNFTTQGGVNFLERNSIRYSGPYEEFMRLENGSLVIVMTDLTPSCNLLGKAGIINSYETILHNQRIGKIIIQNKILLRKYLYFFFNSSLFSQRMKSTATGSTVRHTSVPSVVNTNVPLPPLSEQTAIAEALSDADAMIASLEKLIDKKKKIKQGAMQELLKPKEGWVSYLIEDICQVLKGNGLSKEVLREGGINNCILYGELFTCYNEIIRTTISSTDFHTSVSSKAGDVLFPGSTTTSGIDLVKSSALLVDGVLLGGDIIVLRQRNTNYNSVFLSYYLNIAKRFEIAQKTSGTTIHHLYGKDLKDIVVELPNIETQNQIAKSLEDIQDEIDILERKRSKAVLLKQGMMQNLLTGKIRLI